jgi:hypothetical protein
MKDFAGKIPVIVGDGTGSALANFCAQRAT